MNERHRLHTTRDHYNKYCSLLFRYNSNGISVTNRNIKRNGKWETWRTWCVRATKAQIWPSDGNRKRAEDEKFYGWWPVNAQSCWSTKVSQQNALWICLRIWTPPALFVSLKWHCLCAPPSMKSRLFSFVHGSNHFLITALLVVCMTFKCLCVFARARRRVYFLHVCEVQSLLLSRWRRQDIRCRQQLVCVFATPHIRSGKLF